MTLEAVEGDARNVLCEAVEKHHASILVVGSHGYGAIKRYLSQTFSLTHAFMVSFIVFFLHVSLFPIAKL